MILQNLTDQELRSRIQPCLQKFAKALVDRSELIFNNLTSRRRIMTSIPIENDSDVQLPREWETSGACYGMPKQRSRPYYEDRDGS